MISPSPFFFSILANSSFRWSVPLHMICPTTWIYGLGLLSISFFNYSYRWLKGWCKPGASNTKYLTNFHSFSSGLLFLIIFTHFWNSFLFVHNSPSNYALGHCSINQLGANIRLPFLVNNCDPVQNARTPSNFSLI